MKTTWIYTGEIRSGPHFDHQVISSSRLMCA